jgi:hemerythrin-like domain-containing protein
MQVTDILRHEHRVIEHGINSLEIVAKRLRNNQIPSLSDINELLDFFAIFADQCHHAKEEDILFPNLEERGLPRDGGPIGVMLFEHEKGRYLRSRMANALPQLANEDGCRWSFIRAAEEYIELMRGHIYKEDNVLFEMASQVLSQEDDAKLAAQFEKKEHEMGEGVHEKYHTLIHKLEDRM